MKNTDTLCHVFLDTNYFLHYPIPSEIDWCALIGLKNVLLLVAPIVIRELNSIKDGHKDSRLIRERAASRLKYVLPLIKGGIQTSIRKDVEIKGLFQDPLIDFKSHKLNSEIKDDWLLATIIEYKTTIQDMPVKLVTEDGGLVLKAEAFDIDLIDPPANYRLLDQVDEQELELRQLRQELLRFKTAQPVIVLISHNEKEYFELASEVEDPQIREEEEQWHRERRDVDRSYELAKKTGRAIISAFNDFNEDYPSQLKSYRDYLSQTFRFEPCIKNEGKVQAEEIELEIEFPDFLNISKDLQEKPKISIPSTNIAMINAMTMAKTKHSPSRRVTIKGNIARFSLNQARHHYCTALMPIFLTFKNGQEKKSFNCKFQITCKNVHDIVSGTVNIKVN